MRSQRSARSRRVLVILMALSLPLVPAILIIMIAYNTFGSSPDLLWLWITMFILVEAIAIFAAIGIAREAIGVTRRSDYEAACASFPPRRRDVT